ncbi:MAG: hypothetical protein JSS20_21610, partial [Proteobacteria bacterium]|nr:hypothetical protein [Pseudomonadota bacterium]
MRFRLMLAAMLGALLCYPLAFALAQTSTGEAEADWIRLGEIRLSPYLKQDALELPTDSPFVTAIRLVAKGGSVTLSRVQVLWANDDLHSEDRIIHLLPGERTRPISPARDGARVVRVGAIYSIPADRHSGVLLEVWGLKASSPRAPAVATEAAKRGLYVHRR